MNLEDYLGLPTGLLYCSSAGKESPCNTGDPSSVPGSGRSAGEGIGYPLQYSWASLVAQLAKNLPARQETPVQFLGWEDPLEKSLENSMDCIVHGVTKSRTLLSNFTSRCHINRMKENYHIIISIDSEKAHDKIQHSPMTKTLKLRRKPNVIKAASKKRTANVTLNCETLKAFPLRWRDKARMPIFTTSIKQNTGISSQNN